MTLMVQSPYIHVEDTNGNPYVGAKLYVYLITTTTLANIYSDDGLSAALTNPMTSDSAGNFPRAYIAAGTYKLRAETSAGALIWTEDKIDTGLQAGTGALPISRGGTGSTTASAARTALDVPSNSELADLSADISALTSQVQNIASFPQGYLTLTSGTPVIASDVTAATTVYYTPDVGALVPIYNGTTFTITTFTELSLALNSNHVASTLYDLFVISDSGTTRLVTGPAWNTSTAGSGARGSGAGTTELERTNGLWTNKNSMTARYGATTVTVPVHQGTYVGSMFMDATNGQVSCYRTPGQTSTTVSRKWGIWNSYNRKTLTLLVVDPAASWPYAVNVWRQQNGLAGNAASLFSGLPEETAEAVLTQTVAPSGAGVYAQIGIGVNSSTVLSGQAGNNAAAAQRVTVTARHIIAPTIGVNDIRCLEKETGGTMTTFGGNGAAPAAEDMLMRLQWRG